MKRQRRMTLDQSPGLTRRGEFASIGTNVCWLVLAAAVVVTLISRWLDLDRRIMACFYDPENLVAPPFSQWYLADRQPWRLLYEYGPVPAFLVVSAALFAFIRAIIQGHSRGTRGGLVILLTALIANVLIVDFVCKGHVGRPRPREIVRFGGEHAFAEVGEVGPVVWNSSFPSGHAAAGFLLLAPAFLVSSVSARRLWLLTGVTSGVLVGVARMAQGAHFPTDILWSGVVVYCVASVVASVFLPRSPALTLKAPLATAPNPTPSPGVSKDRAA